MTDYKLAIIKLAAYFEKNLSDEQIVMYAEQLSRSLTIQEVQLACVRYVDDAKNEYFPRPVSKLVSLVKTPVSNEDISQNVSSLILAAERKYGVHWGEGFFQNGEPVYQGKEFVHSTWTEAAASVFGEIGLKVVDRYGGWKNLCLNIYESPDGVIRAQIKNLTNSLQNIVQKTGSFDVITGGQSVGLTQMAKVLEFKDFKNIKE